MQVLGRHVMSILALSSRPLVLQVMTCAVSSGEDVVLKKMLYLYITTYAQHNPDLTLLTINLLSKDCRDQDPTIRGLALRSLCQLRVANLIEYIVGVSMPCNVGNCSGMLKWKGTPWLRIWSGSRIAESLGNLARKHPHKLANPVL